MNLPMLLIAHILTAVDGVHALRVNDRHLIEIGCAGRASLE